MGKFNNINDLKADDSVIEDGIDLSFGKGRFVVITRAGITNRKYKTALARIFKPHQMVNGLVSMDNDEAINLLKEVYAEAVVLGWRGFTDAEGKDIPFSKENCIELFNDAPEIFENVQTESEKFSNFSRKEVSESGKV